MADTRGQNPGCVSMDGQSNPTKGSESRIDGRIGGPESFFTVLDIPQRGFIWCRVNERDDTPL